MQKKHNNLKNLQINKQSSKYLQSLEEDMANRGSTSDLYIHTQD